MQQDTFDMETLNRKLCSVVRSGNNRLKKKGVRNAGISLNHTKDKLKMYRSTGKQKISIDQSTPLVNEFIVTKNGNRSRQLSRQHAQTQRVTVAHTTLKMQNRITQVTQQLHSALASNELINGMVAKLRVQKAECQTQLARLQQQLRIMNRSNTNIVELNESLAERMSTLQRQLEEEKAKSVQKNELINQKERLFADKENFYEGQLEQFRKLTELQREKALQDIAQSNIERSEMRVTFAQAQADIAALKNEKTVLNTELDNKAKEKETLLDELQALNENIREFKQKRSELDKRCGELDQRALNLHATNSELQCQLRKSYERMSELEQQMSKKESELRDKLETEMNRIKLEHKETVHKLEQGHMSKLKELQQFTSSTLLVKDKEINLTKVSTASEIERFKLQFTQMNNAKIEKLNQLKIAEKRMSDLTAQITNKSVLIQTLQEKNMEQRLRIEQLEYTISKMSKLTSEVKIAADRESSGRHQANNCLKQKDRKIDILERENQQLSKECDELVQKLEGFCLKVQKLETHMISESSIKTSLQKTVRELELRIGGDLKNPALEQQLSNLNVQNEQLRRNVKEYKLRQKMSEDKIREIQGQLDQALNNYNAQKQEIQKLTNESQKARNLSYEVESTNRISEINLKSLLKNLQEKEQFSLTLKDQLVKQQFRNDLLVTELKALKQNHRAACSLERCPKNNTPVLDDILKDRSTASRRTDSAFRTIDTNRHVDEQYRYEKMTI